MNIIPSMRTPLWLQSDHNAAKDNLKKGRKNVF